MNLYIILDLNQNNWQTISNPKKALSALLIFLNAFHKLSNSNKILIINNKKIILDSSKEEIHKLLNIINNKESKLTQDFGYALCHSSTINEKSRFLIFNIHNINEEEEYLNLLKCSYAAQKMKKRVDAICLSKHCYTINQICYATGGLFCDEEEDLQEFLFSILGNKENEMPYFGVKCMCHGKEIAIGMVCPVCLAIYCGFIPICKKCKTKINFIK